MLMGAARATGSIADLPHLTPRGTPCGWNVQPIRVASSPAKRPRHNTLTAKLLPLPHNLPARIQNEAAQPLMRRIGVQPRMPKQ